MSHLYDYWESRSSSFHNKLNKYHSLDKLLLTTLLSFNNNKTKLTSKTKITSTESNSTPSLTGLTELSLNHTINPNLTLSLSQKENQTTLNATFPLYNKGSHLITLLPKVNLIFREKSSFSCPTSLACRYHYKNSSVFSLGINDYDHSKGSLNGILNLYGLHGKQLENGLRLYGGLCLGFKLKDKVTPNFMNCVLSLKNETFNTLIDYEMKNEKNEMEKSGIYDIVKGCEKIVNVKSDCKINDKLSIGGHTGLNVTKGVIKNVFFANYDIDKEMVVKGKWEDVDKSVTVTFYQKVANLVGIAVSGRVCPIKKEGGKGMFVPFKTKIGVSLDFNGSLL